MNASKSLLTLSAAALAVLGFIATPSTAQAQEFHITGLAGVTHMSTVGAQGPSLTGTLHAEATIGSFLWMHLGGYFDGHDDFSNQHMTVGYGGLITVRPHIPLSPIDPMGFVSVGYLNYPTGGTSSTGGWNAQLGLGVVIHTNNFLDIEARGAVIQMINRDEAVLDSTGYTFQGGLTLHL